MDILNEGYEITIRAKFGVDEFDLTDNDINNSKAPLIAEAITKKRISDYAVITDNTDLFFLEEAILNYVCYLLCPVVSKKVNIEVKTLDTTWKKEKINWSDLASYFLNKYEEALLNIESVDVDTGGTTQLIDKIEFDYVPIGE
jgi:hypothetical protein